MTISRTDEEQILLLIENYRQAYITKDIPTMLSLFAPAGEMLLLGALKDFHFFTLDDWQHQIEHDLSQRNQIEINVMPPLAFDIIGDCAWIVMLYDFSLLQNQDTFAF